MVISVTRWGETKKVGVSRGEMSSDTSLGIIKMREMSLVSVAARETVVDYQEHSSILIEKISKSEIHFYAPTSVMPV